jgi:DNA-binding Lrp family transcriptional regulator
MAKSSKEDIVKDEQRILEKLKTNANKSINEIAKECGFSRQKVWRIIKQLEKNRIIWGYTAIIDEEKQGNDTYIILIKRTTHPLDKDLAEKIISRQIEEQMDLLQCKMVTSLYTHGLYDWILIITAKEIKQAKQVCELLRMRYQKYLSEVILIKSLFPLKIQGITNPDSTKLKDFLA